MTPNDIEESARQLYNAVGDSFFTQAMVWDAIHGACLDMARETLCIERAFTAPTVVDQEEYDYPTNAISIKRMTYDGIPLAPISFDEKDTVSLSNSVVTSSGTPAYYSVWNEVIYLTPKPAAVGTIKIFAHVEPQRITAGNSTIEIPTQFHMGIVDHVLSRMNAKDKDFQSATYYDARWEKTKVAAKLWTAKKKRGDKFPVVKDESLISKVHIGGL